MLSKNLFVARITFLFTLIASCHSFAPPPGYSLASRPTSPSSSSRLYEVAAPPPGGDDDGSKRPSGMEREEEFNLEDKGASVDWDAEWKKVMKEQKSGKPVQRPGDGYYKSEAEISAIRAANQATEKLNRAASGLPSLPTWNSVKGDWKFWIGIIVAISIGTSLLTAQTPPPSAGVPPGGSYYI